MLEHPSYNKARGVKCLLGDYQTQLNNFVTMSFGCKCNIVAEDQANVPLKEGLRIFKKWY